MQKHFRGLGLPILAFLIAFLAPKPKGVDSFVFKTASKIKTTVKSWTQTDTEPIESHLVTSVPQIQEVKAAIDQDLDINKIPLDYVDLSYSTDKILDDPSERIGEDFKVPEDLKTRVGFWFDIYTRYTVRFSLIHDINRPWIVYKVVDARPIYEQKINIFQKDIKERHAVAMGLGDVKRTLLKLSKRKTYSNLSDDEAKYFELLKEVPGKRKDVFKRAASNLRSQKGQKNFMRRGIAWSAKYIQEMEQIFASYDLPPELVRLPLVESSFNEGATSKVGASGIWQFMSNTGKRYLKVTDAIDERNAPLKATEAAARLMLSNFKILKNWPLAVTAYNHGAGGLIKASKNFNTVNLAEIIKKHPDKSFGFASENFFSEFLAALHAERYQQEIFGLIPKNQPLLGEHIKLKYSIRLGTLTELLGLTLEEIKLYNPDLKSRTITLQTKLPSRYRIRLPVGGKERLDMFYQRAQSANASKDQS